MLMVRVRTVVLACLGSLGCAQGALEAPQATGHGVTASSAMPVTASAETAVGRVAHTTDMGTATLPTGIVAEGPYDATAPVPEAPLGTWYLNAAGARWAVTLVRSVAGGYTGTLSFEDSNSSELLQDVQWDAATGRLQLRFRTQGWTIWCDARVTEGVLAGRWAQTEDAVPPDALSYTGHVTGWNADVQDRGLVPRVWEIIWPDGRLGRLRVDRAAQGSSTLVGSYKVYGTAGSTTGEQPEYAIANPAWDGTRLAFQVTLDGAVWAYTATAHGRTLTGTATTPGCGCSQDWVGTRAEVLGHGLSARAVTSRDAWQAHTRAAMARLIMAGGPAPTSTHATVLVSDGAPVANPATAPERDDDSTRPQAYTLTELRFDSTLADPYGGADLTRTAHGYVARPTTPPPAGGYPVVLAVNGHGGSAHQVMDPSSMYWYGDGYARQGFLVVSVDISHRPLADRGGVYNDYLVGDDPGAGNGLHPAIVSPGRDTDWEEDGERVWDALRALDYALARTDVDPTRVLVTGLSMGGEIATLVGALDTRVRAVVPAGYSPDLGVVSLHGNHPCWRWAHGDLREYLDVSDYHGLIAPRPLVVETGESDGTYSNLPTPFAGDKQVLVRSRAAFGADAGRLVHYLHPGAHTYRVGDPAPDTGLPRGVTVPMVIAPDAVDPVAWQFDASTLQRRSTLFDLEHRDLQP